MDGLLLVDKPAGMTSTEVVRKVKPRVKPSKVGHSGTLDPAATGLLVILIGSGTRTLDYLDERQKEYLLTIRFGEETDTCDREGEIVDTGDPSNITLEAIEKAVEGFIGLQDQVPPVYSAIKKNGTPLYKLARQGVEVEVQPRKVEIFSLDILEWTVPFLRLNMVCSKGTYARSTARDLGRELGAGGRLEDLRRTRSGRFSVDDACTVDDIVEGGRDFIADRLIDLMSALGHIPEITAMPGEVSRLAQGITVTASMERLFGIERVQDRPPTLLKAASSDGKTVVLVSPGPSGNQLALRPVKVFKAS